MSEVAEAATETSADATTQKLRYVGIDRDQPCFILHDTHLYVCVLPLSLSLAFYSNRNIAVIAHVDHGKTTLVDALIRQSGVFRDAAQADEAGTCVMDSEDQERERGITILAKNLAVLRGDVKINIMDTPGHADFGGEVERVLNMADGVLLVVDSVEGPKPQTRFVLDKALKKGMKALVVVNKVDRPAARPDYVVDKVFDLFAELGATDEQQDFEIVYASGLQGIAGDEPDQLADDMGPLFDAILRAIDPPKVESNEPNRLQAMVSNIIFDPFKGKMGIARITNGFVKSGQSAALAHPDKPKKTGRVGNLFVFDNLGQKEIESGKSLSQQSNESSRVESNEPYVQYLTYSTVSSSFSQHLEARLSCFRGSRMLKLVILWSQTIRVEPMLLTPCLPLPSNNRLCA